MGEREWNVMICHWQAISCLLLCGWIDFADSLNFLEKYFSKLSQICDLVETDFEVCWGLFACVYCESFAYSL